jgi:hypothetical protein
VKIGFACCRSVFEKDAVKTPVICFSHGGGNTDISGHSCNYQIFDAFDAEEEFEVSVGKSTTSGLVDDRLIIKGVQLWDDIVAWLTTDQ